MKKRTEVDRRSGLDRRVAQDVAFVAGGNIERRTNSGKRSIDERRSDWVRLDTWSSVRMPGRPD